MLTSYFPSSAWIINLSPPLPLPLFFSGVGKAEQGPHGLVAGLLPSSTLALLGLGLPFHSRHSETLQAPGTSAQEGAGSSVV